MKKIIAASVLCTSLLGASFSVTEAAYQCPTPTTVKTFPQSNQMSQTGVQQNWINEYLKRYQQGKAQAKPAVQQPTQQAPKPQQPTAPTQAQAPVAGTPTTQGLTADEKQMLDLVNQERAKQGIAPLKINMEVQKLARMKAKDMIDKNYFSHQSPTYGSPFDMMKRYGVTYRTAGENIAGNSSVQGAHTSLMNSDGHRKNILNSAFTEVGIGIVDGGPYGKMFVQMFKG